MNKKKKDTSKYLFIEHSETVTFLLICTKSIKLNNHVMKKMLLKFHCNVFYLFYKNIHTYPWSTHLTSKVNNSSVYTNVIVLNIQHQPIKLHVI